MSEIKPGDVLWQRLHFVLDPAFGLCGVHDDDDLLPDSPALPKVARLLAERGDEVRSAVADIRAAFDDPKFGFDDDHLEIWHETEPRSRHGLLLRADTLLTLRKIAAALEGNDGN